MPGETGPAGRDGQIAPQIDPEELGPGEIVPPTHVREGQGRVVFVGAGPGAADLISLRGARIIARADIIIWASSLVSPEVIADHRPGAEVIDSASVPLEGLIPAYTRARDEGLLVARVHTGDPALYGAIAEQRDLCHDLGLAVETVPGISAVFAAAARVGVELTVPEVSQSLTITRLEGGRTPMPPGETIASFAAHGATMAIYLSAARNRALQEALLDGGYPPDTPCVVGYAVSWPDELVLRCRLSQLSETMRAHKLWKHTIVLVGPSVGAGPISTRSHLYHPGFRHEYRGADPTAQQELRAQETSVNGTQHGKGHA